MILRKFVDPLPIPEVIQPKHLKDGIPFYEVEMQQFKQKLHRDLPATTIWGYNGQYPGPTFVVHKDQKVKVKWVNSLPNKHLLPVDKTVNGAEPSNPTVRTVVHLHGAMVPMTSDGYPEAWFTNNFQQTGMFFTRKIYEYPNIQPAATLFYHDHAMGITRLNVYAGLAGAYLIRDECEEQLNLPKGSYEIPLIIQDRSFNADGSLFYPTQDAQIDTVYPSIVPEFFGDSILVNGKVWPYLEVEPRKYRFRIVNGSNSRFYRLSFSPGNKFIQIGTEQGFLEKPEHTNKFVLAPGERIDMLVDFSKFKGQIMILTNDAPSPFPNGTPPDENTGIIMQFRVTLPLAHQDTSVMPLNLCPMELLKEKQSIKTRDQTLVESIDEFGRLKMLLEGLGWDDPISDTPILGTVEIWRLINLTPDTHPIHLHLVKFQILDRRPFDVDIYTKTQKIVYTGPKTPPDNIEKGWKDTIQAPPGVITRIIIRFEGFTGRYPWHCHILEHEDHEMMRQYEVLDDEFEE